MRPLLRAVHSHEAVVSRPHSSLQAGASLLARLRQWVPVWRGCSEPPTLNPELVADAVTQARGLTSISGVSIRKFLRGLSVKAHGPDGFSVPLWRQLSLEHCEELGRLYRYLEVQGVCPHQWCFSIIIMLPKNQEIERPKGLMCTLHKVLTRLRWGLVEDWIRKSRHLFWYDAAFPGCATLDVSLKRMIQFERARYQDRHRITIFLDLTTFYESIEHEQLISEAKRLGFPATVLLWVMHAYTGPRILSCPEGTAPAIHATRGLIAGCPAAPALSKVALAAPCQGVLAMRTVVGADLWIDDISVDCESSSARLAAKNALLSLLVSRALLQELKGAGHLPSLKKSYFVCGSYACEKELRRLLMPEDIRIHCIGKDLGVPTTCARRRSTAGQKERLQKGMRRSNNLHALKVGPGKARARLFTASVLASGVWGHQGQGLSPSVRGKLRLQAARINKHQKLGSVIAALDMQEFVGDPVERQCASTGGRSPRSWLGTPRGSAEHGKFSGPDLVTRDAGPG